MSKQKESPGRAPEASSRGGSQSRSRRALTAVVALALAVAGVGLVVSAFRTSDRTPSVPSADTRSSEQIAFATGVGGNWQIFTIAADGAQATQLTDLPTNQFHPVWSPDGTRIAFDAQGGDGEMQILVMDADGSHPQTLTEGPAWNYLPAWSPDGNRITFVSTRDGNDEIYVMNADGSGQERLTTDPDEDLSPNWSPDGTRIAFQSNRGGFNQIYVMDANGSGVMKLADVEGFDPSWSPDGTRIAFATTADGNPEIYSMNSNGSNVIRLTHDPSHDWSPVWSPDGSKVAFESDRDGVVGIYVINSDGTGVGRLDGTNAQACCPAWRPTTDFEPVEPAESVGLLLVTCERSSISVREHIVLAQGAGVHVTVDNRSGGALFFQFAPELQGPWGGARIPPGTADLALQARPGGLTMRCGDGEGAVSDSLQVEVRDDEGLFVPFDLDCPGRACSRARSPRPHGPARRRR